MARWRNRNALAVQSLQETRVPSRGTIEGIYGMIVTQAREPLFYRDLGVPDTVNGVSICWCCICGWCCGG